MRDLKAIFNHSTKAYFKNWKLISFFAIPLLLSLLIPFFSPMPSYQAFGATFLRTGSIPEMTSFEIGVVIVSFLASVFLLSFALVSINLVIKSQRTITNIKTEIVEGIEKYAFKLFAILTLAWVLCLAVSLVSYEYGVEKTVGPLFSFIVYTALFYLAPAIVIDELGGARAVNASISMLKKRPALFAVWLVLLFILLAIPTVIFLAVLPHNIAEFLMLVLNSLLIMPFFVVLQTQMYLTKYTILDKF